MAARFTSSASLPSNKTRGFVLAARFEGKAGRGGEGELDARGNGLSGVVCVSICDGSGLGVYGEYNINVAQR